MKVSHVRFHVFSEEEIESLSVCEVSSSHLYDAGLPHPSSVLDPRMGTTDKRISCSTCLHSAKDCPGHTGHINLAREIYHPLFVDVVLKLLRIVCFFCSKCLLEPEQHVLVASETFANPKKRLQRLTLLCKTKKVCPHCKGPVAKYTKRNLGIHIEWPSNAVFEDEDEKQHAQAPFTATRAYQILKHMSEDDRTFFGFSDTHPKSLILRKLLVPSPSIRPSLMIAEGTSTRTKGNDELTLKLQDIVKLNRQLAEGASEKTNAFVYEQLQGNVAQLMSRDSSGASARRKNGGRISSIKSIKDQIESKNGTVRRFIMGKRSNYSSRSVIGPDPTLDVDQLYVPYTVAASMTLPEQVCEFNRDALTRRVLMGANLVGGASFVDALNGSRIDLSVLSREKRERILLRNGMTVHRTLQDDDYVLFNRQPSLHQESMMGHRVKIGAPNDSRTFRINLACCKSYNADFDGDEMNMHVPQSLGAQSEIRHLFHVKQHLLTPSTNRPIISACQDTLIGAYLLTRRDNFFTRGEVFQLFMLCRYLETVALPPPAIVWPMPLWTGKQILSHLLPSNMYLTKTVRGKHYDRLSDDTVCIHDGELVHGRLCKKTLGACEHGIVHLLALDFSFETAMNFLSDVQRMVIESMRTSGFSIGLDDCMVSNVVHREMSTIIDDRIRAIEDDATRSDESAFRLTQSALDDAGTVAIKHATQAGNAIVDCVHSGAKGSNLNLTQIIACVGQQTVGGDRPTALPAFEDSTHPCARGFVPNSYLLGMTPQQSFQHMQGGRTGIIDTAIKTASTGYVQRKLSKYLENIVIAHDGSVREGQNVVLHKYGGDGYCGKFVESVRVPILTMGDAMVLQAYPFVPLSLLPTLLHHRDALQHARSLFPGTIDVVFRLPYNAERAVKMHRARPHECVCTMDDIHEFIETLEVDAHALKLHTWIALCRHRGTTARRVLAALHARLDRARIQAAEPVGLIASTSIGEPTTQLCLNTFHFAGCSQKSVMGVPRLVELLDGSSNIKTPISKVFFTEPIPLHIGHDIAKRLVHTSLHELILESTPLSTFEDPIDALHAMVRLGDEAPSNCGWSFVLNKPLMQTRHIDLLSVETAVLQFSPCLEAYVSQRKMEVWKCHVRLREAGTSEDMRTLATALHQEVVVTGGSPRIQNATARQDYVSYRAGDGSVAENNEVVVETEGSDLLFLLKLDGVDARRTLSNDVMEVISTLGIEIGLRVLEYEITRVLSYDGTYINQRHIQLLAEAMCFSGHLVAVNRHGFSKSDNHSVLTHCSFEQTFDTLATACLFNDEDSCTSHVTGALFFGNTIPVGTGCVELRTPPKTTVPQNTPTLPFVGRRRGKQQKQSDTDPEWDFFADPLVQWQAKKARMEWENAADDGDEDPWATASHTVPGSAYHKNASTNLFFECPAEPLPWCPTHDVIQTLPGAYATTLVEETGEPEEDDPIDNTSFSFDEPEEEEKTTTCAPHTDDSEDVFMPQSPVLLRGERVFTPLSPVWRSPSPAYDPLQPPSPAYDPLQPPSPAYDPLQPPSPTYDPLHPPA